MAKLPPAFAALGSQASKVIITMPANSSTSLEDRLDRLERSNRNLRRGLVLMTGLPLIALTVAWKSSLQSVEFDQISAREFQVVDEEGRPLIRLDEANGRGRLAILNSAGNMIVVAGGTEHGGIITTNTVEGALSSALGTDSSGRGSIGLHDSATMPSVSLGVEDSGNGYVSVNTNTGKELAVVGSSEEGFGMITTFAEDGRQLVVLSRYLESGYIGAYGENTAPLFGLGTFGQGGGGMIMFGPDGKRMTAIGRTQHGTGLLGMFNEEGNLTAEITADANKAGAINTYDGKGVRTGSLP